MQHKGLISIFDERARTHVFLVLQQLQARELLVLQAQAEGIPHREQPRARLHRSVTDFFNGNYTYEGFIC